MTTGSDNGTARKLVTILAPAYNEAENAAGLVVFFREIRDAHPDLDFELVLVDDGSVDGTAQLTLDALADGDVARVIRLSRNFGSHIALTAGLQLCRGDAVITISTDLQEPLEVFGRFLHEWRTGAEIVWGIRRTRSVPTGLANLGSRIFSSVFHRVSEIPSYPKEGPSQVLLSRQVIDVINEMPERNRNIMAMFAWVGFTQRTIEFDQLPRPAGQSKWTNKKKIRMLIDSFVEFSPAPFLYTTLLGMLLSGLGLLAIVVLAIVGLAAGASVGWGIVLSGVFFVGGLQLAAIGGFGEYLWRAGDDARRRPVYVLRGVWDHGQPSSGVAAARREPASVNGRV